MRPTIITANAKRSFDIIFYSPCVIASTLLHKGTPRRLAYAAALNGQDLPSATVGRNCSQHATAVHLCGVKNVLTVRREARRFVMCRVRQARGDVPPCRSWMYSLNAPPTREIYASCLPSGLTRGLVL